MIRGTAMNEMKRLEYLKARREAVQRLGRGLRRVFALRHHLINQQVGLVLGVGALGSAW